MGTINPEGKSFAQWNRFKQIVSGETKPTYEDLAPDLKKTTTNRGQVLAGNEEYWSTLFKDLKNAKKHIHIQMFYLKEPFSGEFLKVLGERARNGVEVRLLFAKTDNDYKTPEEIVEAAGTSENIDAIIVKRDTISPVEGIDHRKIYVIDGKIGYVTGYTIDKAMRESMFDMALRVEGPVVAQLQTNFFLNYFYRAGKDLRSKSHAADFEAFFAEYFPRPDRGTVDFKILQNIPKIKSEVSDSYIHMVRKAEKRILVADQYYTSPRFTKVLNQSIERGNDVRIIGSNSGQMYLQSYLRTQENNMRHWEKAGAKVSLLPEFVHAKALAVDGTKLSLGSTNRDAMSFTGNLEMNLYSEDPQLNRDFEKQFMLHFARGAKSTSAYRKRKTLVGGLAKAFVETGSKTYGEGVIDLPLIFQWKGKPLFGKKINRSKTDSVKLVMETQTINFSKLPSRIDIAERYPEGYALYNKTLGYFQFTERGDLEFLVKNEKGGAFSATRLPDNDHSQSSELRTFLGASPPSRIELLQEGIVLRLHKKGDRVDHSLFPL